MEHSLSILIWKILKKKIAEGEETPEGIYKETKVIVETEEGKKEAFVYVGDEAKIHES